MEKHIKQVTIEPIRDIDIFKNATLLTKEEVKQAIEDTIKKIDLNMEHIGERFPWSATKDLKYPIIDNIEWTDGFWTGLLWLAYEYTGDEKYRELADKNVDSFHHRVVNDIEIDHHDLGFLYSLSCVASYKLTGSEKAEKKLPF
ncbi:glycoside hydrolase family 88 protein [Erysipelothrix piscisicarius]|uniref:glycoside hydrolase family 88 protein n=1 Tax=Erysipelothrix piscisicarius TaxID=2485784 RepID=UPI002F92C201